MRYDLSMQRLFRFAIAICFSVLMFAVNVFPASASYSKLTKDPDQFSQIEKKSQEVAQKYPQSLQEVETEAKNGLNGIQGDADKDKMKRPENSGRDRSFTSKVEKTLENIQEKADNLIN